MPEPLCYEASMGPYFLLFVIVFMLVGLATCVFT